MNKGCDMNCAETTIRTMKRDIVTAASRAGEGHIASAFSILDLLWVLYDRVLRINPTMPDHEERDRFILSKGHASLGLYAVLARKGFFPSEEMLGFAGLESRLGGHPHRTKLPGVEASTGSLGHGLPMAVGMALGLKIKGSSARVYALIGDGEANEGAIWEAALLAPHHKLDNLCCIVDYNHSTDRALGMGDLEAKFKAFGWTTSAVDGHDHGDIVRGLGNTSTGKPLAVIAHTIKGRGCARMENQPAWHHRAPSSDEQAEMLEELS
jgi:transketolase